MRPRLKRTIERIEGPHGDVILMRASGEDVRVHSPDAGERLLLAALDGTHTEEELEARFGTALVRDTIARMRGLELLEDAEQDRRLPPAERERFDGQLRYLADLATGERSAAEYQERLRDARVAVLGVGGLGGRVAFDLASIGVGELWLIDGDRVETSNLNRQIQYAEPDVGKLKVEAMAARLRAFHSAQRLRVEARRLESEAEIGAFIAGADLVVDAADWPTQDIERWCNAACFAAGIPYITMGHFPPIARVGPLYVPGKTGCFACQESANRRAYPLYDSVVEQRRGRELPAATLGPACGFTAGLLAAEVMHFLTGLVTPPTLGAGYTLDLRTYELARYEVIPEPDCPVCSALFDEVGEALP